MTNPLDEALAAIAYAQKPQKNAVPCEYERNNKDTAAETSNARKKSRKRRRKTANSDVKKPTDFVLNEENEMPQLKWKKAKAKTPKICNPKQVASLSTKKMPPISEGTPPSNIRATTKKQKKKKTTVILSDGNSSETKDRTSRKNTRLLPIINSAKPLITHTTPVKSHIEKKPKAISKSMTDKDTSMKKDTNPDHTGFEAALRHVAPSQNTAILPLSTDINSDSKEPENNAPNESSDRVFSELIDQAARDQWELTEVGKLVRLFASTWEFDLQITCRFLRTECPELVNVEFLEGLGLEIPVSQLLEITYLGSGSTEVILNKVSSMIENHVIRVQDECFLHFLTQELVPRVSASGSSANQVMENHSLDHSAVLRILIPIMECCTQIREIGILAGYICTDWPMDHTVALIQQLFLSPIFDDLEGKEEDLLSYLPAGIESHIDFPSRMQDDDADENGNLKGWVVDDEQSDSNVSDVVSDNENGTTEHHENDSDSDDTNSERFTNNPRSRKRQMERNSFILEEAEEGSESDDSEADRTSREDRFE